MRGATFIAALLLLALACRADEPLKPEQMKKAYDDALVQLKAAQDRKAELARENDALATKVEDLKKQLAASQAQMDAMKREISENDDRTFVLRSYQAAWQSFLRRYPEVMTRWKTFIGQSVLSVPQEAPDVVDMEPVLPPSLLQE